MSIPLIQKPEKDDINTSIIAIKRNIERINMLLGLVDNDSPDLSGFATKQELQDAVNSLQPVDEVTLDNMQSVTSNAVAESLSYSTTEIKTGAKWLDGKDVYKCTLEITVNNADLQVDISSLHVDSFIKMEGSLHTVDWGAYWYPFPFISTDYNHMLQGQYAIDKLYIYAKSTAGAMTGILYTSIFYTKTSD